MQQGWGGLTCPGLAPSIRQVSPAPPGGHQGDPHFQQPWEAVAVRILPTRL